MIEFKKGDRVIAEKRGFRDRKGTVVEVKAMPSGTLSVTVEPDWYEDTTPQNILYRDSDLKLIDVIDRLGELTDA
jgi:hypothetical protein